MVELLGATEPERATIGHRLRRRLLSDERWFAYLERRAAEATPPPPPVPWPKRFQHDAPAPERLCTCGIAPPHEVGSLVFQQLHTFPLRHTADRHVVAAPARPALVR